MPNPRTSPRVRGVRLLVILDIELVVEVYEVIVEIVHLLRRNDPEVARVQAIKLSAGRHCRFQIFLIR